MTRKEIREEIIARGAEAIANDAGGEARLNRWIQQAIRDICDFKPWPFLHATKEGVAPLEIADLGHVIAVIDLTNDNPLEAATLNQLILGDAKLDGVGPAEYWYSEDGKTIKTAPIAAAVKYKVHYRKSPAELGDAEEPIIPKDYHDLVVSRVMVKVYKFTDNFAAASDEWADFKDSRDGMVHALMKPNYDQERRLTRSGIAGDYL